MNETAIQKINEALKVLNLTYMVEMEEGVGILGEEDVFGVK